MEEASRHSGTEAVESISQNIDSPSLENYHNRILHPIGLSSPKFDLVKELFMHFCTALRISS